MSKTSGEAAYRQGSPPCAQPSLDLVALDSRGRRTSSTHLRAARSWLKVRPKALRLRFRRHSDWTVCAPRDVRPRECWKLFAPERRDIS